MALALKVQVANDEYLQKTAPQRKLRTRSKPRRWSAAVGIILCLAIGNVIIQGLVVHKNFQIRNLQSRIDVKERQILKLRIDIANLESFDRVREVAQNELGMKAAGPDDYRIIPAVPAADPDGVTAPREYLAQTSGDRNVLDKIVAWLGGVGKTMANTP
jgi:cell division protein FtsL